MLRVSLRVNDDAHARVGPLAVNVNASKTLRDAEVREYMDAVVAAAKGEYARVSLSYFVHQVPNASQRQIILAAMHEHALPPLERTAVLTDSALMRGALTAYSWFSRSDSSPFAVADRQKALVWLAERAPFDVDEGMTALDGCFRALGIVPP